MKNVNFDRTMLLCLLGVNMVACTLPQKNKSTSARPEQGRLSREKRSRDRSPLTLHDVKTLLIGTTWRANTKNGNLDEIYNFLSENQWWHRYSDVEMHEADITDWQLTFDDGTDKPLLFIAVGSTCLSQLFYFPDATDATLGNRCFMEPATDYEGNVQENTGKLFIKTAAIF